MNKQRENDNKSLSIDEKVENYWYSFSEDEGHSHICHITIIDVINSNQNALLRARPKIE